MSYLLADGSAGSSNYMAPQPMLLGCRASQPLLRFSRDSGRSTPPRTLRRPSSKSQLPMHTPKSRILNRAVFQSSCLGFRKASWALLGPLMMLQSDTQLSRQLGSCFIAARKDLLCRQGSRSHVGGSKFLLRNSCRTSRSHGRSKRAGIADIEAGMKSK